MSEPERIQLPASIGEAFASYFHAWAIALPVELPPGEPVQVHNEHGWIIKVRVDLVDGAPVLEVYAVHRMTNDRHFTIANDGHIDDLEAPLDFMVFPAGASEDDEAEIRERYHADNRRIIEHLRGRGLTD